MTRILAMILALTTAPCVAVAQPIVFGDDDSQWANDGECDDRRFRGASMARGLDRDDVGHDATDCRAGYETGQLQLWDIDKARVATRCNAIDFGDDSSEWPHDGLCDDYRFDGPGADHVLLREDTGRDASDCRALCDLGEIAIRDY